MSRLLPLRGVRVIEIAGLAPAPFAGMVLADFGANVIKVDRIRPSPFDHNVLDRGKRSVALDLKADRGVQLLKDMVAASDVLIDPFRPGVLERLGLAPELLLALNPRIIVTRLTGYGQRGPRKSAAGHDINYLAVSGLLSRLGRADSNPLPPLNLLADFAGGGLTCALGVMLALFERDRAVGGSGRGQVIDCSMVDGAMYASAFLFNYQAMMFANERGRNMLDGGAPFYDCYQTADERFVAVGAIEPQFFAELLRVLGLEDEFDAMQQMDSDAWPLMRARFAHVFGSRTQAEWCDRFDGVDACVTPVLELDQLGTDSYHTERGTFQSSEGARVSEPQPAPLLSRTPAERTEARARAESGEHTLEILQEFGIENAQRLVDDCVVRQAARSKL